MQVERRSLALPWLVALALVGCSDDGGTNSEAADESAGTDDEVGTTETESGDTNTESGSSDSSSDDPTTDTTDTDPTTDTTDTDPTTDTTTETGDGDGDPQGDDYDQPGPYGVDESTATMQVSSCNTQMEYGIFEPDTQLSDTPVLLAHGFMRSIEAMAPTAQHIASWGVTVYTVPLCTNSFQINHQQNGDAIAELGQALAPNGAVYAGFSAGGLAAWVAAGTDPGAVGYVGLDAVDNNGLANQYVDQVTVPIRGMIAEGGQCNTNNNFLPVYDQVAGAPVIKINDAQHFDFETDSCGFGDFGCNFCAPNGPDTRALALGLTTAAVLWETGADLGGQTWWQPGGSYFDALVQQGAIMYIP